MWLLKKGAPLDLSNSRPFLGGGFKYFLFSTLFGEMIAILTNIFFKWVETTNQKYSTLELLMKINPRTIEIVVFSKRLFLWWSLHPETFTFWTQHHGGFVRFRWCFPFQLYYKLLQPFAEFLQGCSNLSRHAQEKKRRFSVVSKTMNTEKKLGGGFKYFSCLPLLEEMIQLAKFFRWVAQPPTRLDHPNDILWILQISGGT